MAYEFDIIDVTLRDGSNAVDFQFTSEETYGIVEGLSKAGIKWIEVGHGLGLGASARSGKVAKETDETYIKTARNAARDAKIGCFFIQNIGTCDDIKAARSWGLDFLRIGPNASMEEIIEAVQFIKYAKEQDLIVHCCVRKAYAVTPDELARQAQILEEAGADNIIVMDSAGNLMPNQVKEYITAIKDKFRGASGIKIGFHAHDNMGLATACTIAAIEAGADTVDTCLKGLGRSAGNTPTEYLIAALMRLGIVKGDLYALQDLGDRWIGHRAYETLDSISLIFGMSGFHSAFYGMVKEVAGRYNIDPRIIVTEICKVDKIAPTAELAEEIAKQISNRKI
ncbi:MAG TPA: 4-hydroxy-2-oxovalerate aldolase [Sedimentibacter sp.]|nr:4-hydroxy-2-oxovalerate aldolase [Sedimentibacter sp.]